MKGDAPLTFSVTYRLGEYLAIVRSHALAVATPDKSSRYQRLMTRLLVAVVGSIAFLVKSRRIGTCEFEIDATGISRQSRLGRTEVPWSKVTALHAYESGFIIATETGGMPIPFRVLTGEQRGRLASMAAQYTSGANAE